jgi:hypothetical protein
MIITLDDQIAEATIPAWLSVNAAKKEITVKQAIELLMVAFVNKDKK